jgi:hypothetical protein
MRKPLVAAILELMATLAFSSVMLAQTANKTQAPKSAASASVPNLSGLWSPVGDVTLDPSDPEGAKAADLTKYPMTPWGLEKFKANRPAHGAAQSITYGEGQVEGSNDPINMCLPPGVPRVYLLPSPLEIVQAPDKLVMLFEYNSLFRIIYLNGRERPKDADPAYMGWSNGHWKGDTLVVDATGFNAKGWLDRVGHPYSEELQLRERFRRVDPQTLQLDITIHDPKAYTRDWTGQKIFKLHSDWHLGEYFCEDQYLFDDFQKKAGFTSFLPKK